MKPRIGKNGSDRAAGFTLVELAVVMVLTVVVLGSVALVADSSERMYSTETVDSQLDSRVTIVMPQIVSELRMAGIDTLAPDLLTGPSSSLEFIQAVDVTPSGNVVWTDTRRIEFQLETGEIDDGIDNNGNELADEGVVVLITDVGLPTEQTVVLTHWVRELLDGEIANGVDDNGNGLVDEAGFVIERIDDGLVLRLTLERRDEDGRVMTVTSETTVRPRNRFVPVEEEE